MEVEPAGIWDSLGRKGSGFGGLGYRDMDSLGPLAGLAECGSKNVWVRGVCSGRLDVVNTGPSRFVHVPSGSFDHPLFRLALQMQGRGKPSSSNGWLSKLGSLFGYPK